MNMQPMLAIEEEYEEDIYSPTGIEASCEDDAISAAEEGFMLGYLDDDYENNENGLA